MAEKIRIGLSLSLTGAYAPMGRQAEAALALFVSDANSSGGIRIAGEPREVELHCLDDASSPERCAEIYHSLCSEHFVDVVLGPYSSQLTRVAAPIAEHAGMLLVNHGGADDDIFSHRHRLLVGILSPASDYFNGFVHLVAGLKMWRKRIAIVRSNTGFAEAIAKGIERECKERYARRKGVRIRVKYAGAFDPDSTPGTLFPALRRNRVNALVSAGSYEHDVAVMRAMTQSSLNLPVLGCVAAGVERFRVDLGEDAEGLVGPSQWEEQIQFRPEVGPTPRDFIRSMRAQFPNVTCDYPAAQAYAAALLTRTAIETAQSLDANRIREAFSDLRTTTFFGDFAIDRVTGRQIGHRVLLVQWHGGHKVVINPEAHVETGTLEFPTGWRLIVASFQKFKLTRHEDEDDHDGAENGNEKTPEVRVSLEGSTHLAIGLMSGTSHDGVSAAVVRLDERATPRAQALAFRTFPYATAFRERLLALASMNDVGAPAVSSINFELGKIFGTAAIKIAQVAKVPLSGISFIGSHGHTIFHLPPRTAARGQTPSTMQIGESSVIAAMTGLPVVADFRPMDMALGGEAAPLAPLAHFWLFGDRKRGRVIQNIGGIGNATYLKPGGALNDPTLIAFDTGPGGMLIDALVNKSSGGKSKMDRDGRIAARGRVNEEFLAELMRHPYFRRRPPKSTGREEFGSQYLAEEIEPRAYSAGVAGDDLIATVTALTAHSIGDAVSRFILPLGRVDQLIATGGGAHNPTLLRMIQSCVPKLQVLTAKEVGVDGDSLEVVAFAILGHQMLRGRQGNIPSVTGARSPAILGKLTIPPTPPG